MARRYFDCAIFLLLSAPVFCPVLVAQTSSASLQSYTLSELENRLSANDSEKNSLAICAHRNAVGNLGWESKRHVSADSTEWAEVHFEKEARIDQIVLVPVLWRDTEGQVQADGFPVEFEIVVGDDDDTKGHVVGSFSEADHLLPRDAPVVISIPPTDATWVRIQATRLSPRISDGKHLFQLSEILVFSGAENVALRCPVQVSSSLRNRVRRSTPIKSLVDGFMPYLMNSSDGNGGLAYVAFFGAEREATVSLDLGESYSLNRIHLHSSDFNSTVPNIHHSDYALPVYLVVEGANLPDFSDSVTLIEYRKESIYDAGPILMWQFAPTACRYVRLRAVEAYKAPEASDRYRCVGFAEIEIFSGEKNVALNKPAQISFEPESEGDWISEEGDLSGMTDGKNRFGQILPVKLWLNQLARRHELELEHTLVRAELDRQYAKQKRKLRWLTFIAVALTAGIAFTVLVDRIIRLRETTRLKERFAADLHDELGADLHAIGILSNLAQDALDAPEKIRPLLQEIRDATNETGRAIRELSERQSQSPYSDLPKLMQQVAHRVVDQLDHDFHVDHPENLQRLSQRSRMGLFLFYKECLVNISRHSGATQLRTRLVANPKEIQLTISDNGYGLSGSNPNAVPHSLQRRAKLLGAKVVSKSRANQGVRIELSFKVKRWFKWLGG